MTKPIRCLAVDDEPIALEKLQHYIEKIPFLSLVAACEDAFDAMQAMNGQEVDAMFIDINMPDLNGLDFVESLSQRPLIVFTTAYAQYAVDSFKVAPVDYLLKPFNFSTFQRAANRVLQLHELQMQEKPLVAQPDALHTSDSLYVKVEYKYVRVEQKDIRYIEGMSDYLRIYLTTDSKPLITHSTFLQIKEYLSPNFLQVHRSYIVNMDQLKEVSRLRIVMDKDTWIPVGETYKDEFMDYLQKRSIGKKEKKVS